MNNDDCTCLSVVTLTPVNSNAAMQFPLANAKWHLSAAVLMAQRCQKNEDLMFWKNRHFAPLNMAHFDASINLVDVIEDNRCG